MVLKPKLLIAILVVLTVVPVALALILWSQLAGQAADPNVPPADPGRLAELKNRLEYMEASLQQRELAWSRLAILYQPAKKAKVDDLTCPTADLVDLLGHLPYAMEATTKPVPKPTTRIIQFLDLPWHSQADFAVAHPDQAPAEVNLLYKISLTHLALLQVEHLTALACLRKRHALTEVWAGGLVPEKVKDYVDMVAAMKAENAKLRQLEDAKENGEPSAQLQLNRLQFGAPAQLLEMGLLQVLPLDDAQLLEQARNLEPEKVKARELAIVKNLLAHPNKCQVIVLDGTHDLTSSIQALSKDCEYLRVMTKTYQDLNKQKK